LGNVKEKRSYAGKVSAIQKQILTSVDDCSTNSTVTDNVNVNVTVNDNSLKKNQKVSVRTVTTRRQLS